MDIEFFFRQVAKSLILPPGLFIAVSLYLLFKYRHFHQHVHFRLGAVTILLTYTLSTPYFSRLLVEVVEVDFEAQTAQRNAQAIVVLGGGNRGYAPEFGGQTSSLPAIERLRYASYLQRQTKLPILITASGKIYPDQQAEADLMQKVLTDSFNTRAQWWDDQSRNTFDNAQNSWKILSKRNLTRIFLVSDARHLARAQQVFQQAGFTVYPAPTNFEQGNSSDPMIYQLLPHADSLRVSYIALHELAGQLWYWLRY